MPSCNTYHLTWVSLTLDEGYLFTAAPPDLERGVAPLGPPVPALSMPANSENSAVATGLEKVSFHSNPKKRQCQRMLKLLHSCIHLTRS